MASAERPPVPFGLRRATPEQVGLLARRLMEDADAAIRRSRPRALLLLVPFLAFYVLYAGLLALVLWGLGARLDTPAFLGLVALAFALMAVLGKHYRAGEMEVEGEMPRILAVMVLQAYVLRAFTWFFFVIPYLAFRNLTRLFPRRARVSPEVLEAAVQIGAALDTAVTAHHLQALLPPGFPERALGEALVLLEWAGTASTHARGTDLVVQPGPAAGALLAALPERAEVVPLSVLIASPEAPEPPAEEPPPAPLPAPRWLQPLADRPGLGLAVGAGAIALVWALVAAGMAWYRHLPVALERPALPNVGGAAGLSFAEGRFAVCGSGTVDLYDDLAAAPAESHRLQGLLRTDLRLRPIVEAPVSSPDEGPGFDDGGSPAWDVPEEREVSISFSAVYSAVPDPAGHYLLVYGKWNDDDVEGSSGGRAGAGVVDLEEGSFTPQERFGGWELKGWWEEGTLLAVTPSRGWDQGGGSTIRSSNLAGVMAALDPDTGQSRELHRSPHAFFGLAGTEGGRRIFLGADWKADQSRRRATCTLTEYREFQKSGRFTLTLKQFNPFLYNARLDATGRYWILAFGSVPGIMEQDQGVLYTVWIVSRGGGRRTQVLEVRREDPYMFFPFPFQGRSMLSYLQGTEAPQLLIRELRL